MNGIDFIQYKNWAVVGDVTNEEKYAFKILQKFKDKNYNVYGVTPKIGEGRYTKLSDIKEKIECVDLCINPKLGLKYVEEAKKLGIKNILIQPGAESIDILKYCEENDMVAIEGCALVLLNYVPQDILEVYNEANEEKKELVNNYIEDSEMKK